MTANNVFSTIGNNYYNINSRDFVVAFWMFRKNIFLNDNCYFKIPNRLHLCFDQNLNLNFGLANFQYGYANLNWESNFRLSYLNNYLNTRSEQWNYYKFIISTNDSGSTSKVSITVNNFYINGNTFTVGGRNSLTSDQLMIRFGPYISKDIFICYTDDNLMLRKYMFE